MIRRVSWKIQVTGVFCHHYIMVAMIWSHKHMGTSPQAEVRKLCERLLLPSRGVFWIDPEIHSSVLDSLSARPNGSLSACLSHPSRSSHKQAVGCLWVPSQRPDGRGPSAAEKALSVLWGCRLFARSATHSTAEGNGEVSHPQKAWDASAAQRRTQREALSQKILCGSVTKYLPVLSVSSIASNAT